MCEIEILGLESGENAEILVLNSPGSAADAAEESSAAEGNVSAADESASAAEGSVDSAESNTTSEYMSVFPSGYENLSKDAKFIDRLAYGGKVTLIGMATVFLVLVLIWALCALMGKIFGGVGKTAAEDKKASRNDNPQPSAPKAEVPVSAPASAPVSAPAAAAVDYGMVSVVASAAIAAYRGEDVVNFNITSIKPCVNGAVALPPEVVAQIAASIACLEGKDTVDFTISSIRII